MQRHSLAKSRRVSAWFSCVKFCNGRVQLCGVKVLYCFAVYGIVSAGRGSVGSCDVKA